MMLSKIKDMEFKHSKLDEYYSLSSKITCAEFVERMPGYRKSVYKAHAKCNLFLDFYTGKVSKEFIKEIRSSCPLCKSKSNKYLFMRHGFDHMLCLDCDAIYTREVFDHKSADEYLKVDGQVYEEFKSQNTISELDRKKYKYVFDEVQKYTEVSSILDIGSNTGGFLDWASEKWDVIGHEYHDGLRSLCENKKHNVYGGSLANLNLDRKFDVITCWDYLDHITNPHEVIKNLGKYLRKGGVFFFAINNRDSLSVRMLHEASPIFLGQAHTIHYGINQLNLLMDTYELKYVDSYVSELNWISNWLNFKNPEFGDAPLMHDLLDPKKICSLGMGFKVNAIYSKE